MSEPKAENQRYKITTKNKLESQLIELIDQTFDIRIQDTNTPLSSTKGINLINLINVINKTFNIQLNNNLIQQKSISEIADFMLLETKAKKRNMVMPLNGVKGKPPLYFVCGITLYSPLAKNLSEHFSCYGIYVPQEEHFFNHDADQKNSLTIPHLATHYVEAIIKHIAENDGTQKTKVTIAGVSFGGILAFEIARQLKQKKYEVSGLVILDAMLPGALTRPWSLIIKLAVKKINSQLNAIVKRWSPSTSLSTKAKISPREKRKIALWKVIQGKAVQAYFNSFPTFNGPSLIVRAADQHGHKVEPSLCWSPKLKGPIFLGESPGTHLEVLQSSETAKLILTNIAPHA